nr:permease [Streptococcus saliviloxodontae]
MTSGDQLVATLNHRQLVIETSQQMEVSSIKNWHLGLINMLVGLYFFLSQSASHTSQLALSGPSSIATYTITVSGIIGVAVFVFYFYRNRQIFLEGLPNRLFWRILMPITLAFGVILGLIVIGFFWLMGYLFQGVSFDVLTASIIVTVSSFATSVAMARTAVLLRADWLTSLFTVIIISGVVLAMATNSSRQWWQVNLSFLGTQKAIASWQFNLTLILSALILLVLVDYLFSALSARFGRSMRLLILRGLLSALAFDLGAVGYFPNDLTYHHLHTELAGYLVYIIIVLIVGVRWLVPKINRDFQLMSYGIGLILIGLELLFKPIGYLSLTAFEMSAFLLAFTWLVILIAQLEQLIDHNEK